MEIDNKTDTNITGSRLVSGETKLKKKFAYLSERTNARTSGGCVRGVAGAWQRRVREVSGACQSPLLIVR